MVNKNTVMDDYDLDRSKSTSDNFNDVSFTTTAMIW